MSNEALPNSSRRPLLLVFAIFLAPLAAAFLVYYGFDWRPTGDTSNGDLITPARPLPAVGLPTPEGGLTPATFLHEKWSMVYIGNGACDADCRRALTDMRQVRLALNNEMTRVQRVFLYAGDCCDAQYFAAEQAGLIIAKIDGETGAALLAQFPSDGDRSALERRRVYLVDPLGNLMMSYAPEAAAKGMLTDLKKVLKLSHIG